MGLKILLIMHDINYGGASKMFTYLSNELTFENNQVHVYTYDGRTPNYKLKSKVHYHYESKLSKNIIVKRLKPLFLVRRKIREVDPDVVISFLPNANVYSIIGTLFTNKKVIITERSDPYTENGILMNMKRILYNLSNGAVFQTNGAKNYYPKVLQKKSCVIPNPVTINKIARIPSHYRNKEIAFVARFDLRQKRQDIMIEAFQKVLLKHPDVKLGFYGDGNDINIIKNMVKDKGLSNNITFYGKVTNILDKIKYNLMFVSTSDYEGISNSLIEAMSLGMPVISTDSSPGGAKMLIKNGINGVLVGQRNIEEISNSIIELIELPHFADKIGEEAQSIIDTYSSEKIIKYWNTYINEVVNND